MPGTAASVETAVLKRRQQRDALLASFLGWTLDAFDYFILVMALTEIAREFHKSDAEIAFTLTATLAFRPLGAFLFGILADRYGRRLPLLADVLFYSVVEIASGLAPNYATFLVLRALFGIGMGGEWGVGASLAMEAVPARWRGILSGVLREGYTAGYILACLAYLLLCPLFGWRAMFFVGGAPAALAWFLLRRVRESEVWERTRRKDWAELGSAVRAHVPFYLLMAAAAALAGWPAPARCCGLFAAAALAAFMADVTWRIAQGHRKLFCYMLALMTMMCFVSHGTQDMYPTLLKVHRGFGPRLASVVTLIGNLGAMAGGVCGGLFSDRFGRRRGIATALVLGFCVIPLWAYAPTTALLACGAFVMQFMVQGSWGVIPAHITELSPNSVRGFFPGFAYQCGVLLAGSVGYLEALFAERMNYANAVAATAATVLALSIAVVLAGREKKGVEFG